MSDSLRSPPVPAAGDRPAVPLPFGPVAQHSTALPAMRVLRGAKYCKRHGTSTAATMSGLVPRLLVVAMVNSMRVENSSHV